jgi:glycosyltransferase involved in cell wall biosynthesis
VTLSSKHSGSAVAPPLRILLMDPHMGGGGQVRYVTSLTERFTAWGHHVSIACKAGSVLAQRGAQAGGRVLDIFEYRRGLRLGAWWRDITRLRRLVREEHFDVLHVNGSQDHWVAAFARLLGGLPAPLIRTRHNTYRVPVHAANRLLNRGLTDYQICVCEEVRRDLAALQVFDAGRMCAIHNGVDPDLYQPDAAARQSARTEFGFTEEHFVFGIAARLNKAKGHEYLFRAAALLHSDFPQMRLLLLGEGELEAPLRALAEQLGISGVTVFAGFRNDMARCTQAFDAGVLPSIDCDTSSFSLKEEMAAAKPIVCSDYGGLKEIVSDGLEGRVVPAGTHEPLAAAMRQLLEDPGLCAAYGQAGRERVLREFSLDAFASRTLAVYRKVIEVRHARIAS